MSLSEKNRERDQKVKSAPMGFGRHKGRVIHYAWGWISGGRTEWETEQAGIGSCIVPVSHRERPQFAWRLALEPLTERDAASGDGQC